MPFKSHKMGTCFMRTLLVGIRGFVNLYLCAHFYLFTFFKGHDNRMHMEDPIYLFDQAFKIKKVTSPTLGYVSTGFNMLVF